jgi:hypothetical protein
MGTLPSDVWPTPPSWYIELAHCSQFLSNLAREMDVNQHLGLPLDIPLEQATLVASLYSEGSIDTLPEHSASLRQADIEHQAQPEVSHLKK